MGNCSSNKNAVAVSTDGLSTSHIKLESKKPYAVKSNLSHSSNTSVTNGSRRAHSKFAIGQFENYMDLEPAPDSPKPGWFLESDSRISYSILMSELIAVKLLHKFKRYPALATVPEYCNGIIHRSEYKGYNVVVFKITHPENNKILIDRCTRKLRACGPPEFDNIMTFYGTDYHIVFTDWLQEERSLKALSNIEIIEKGPIRTNMS